MQVISNNDECFDLYSRNFYWLIKAVLMNSVHQWIKCSTCLVFKTPSKYWVIYGYFITCLLYVLMGGGYGVEFACEEFLPLSRLFLWKGNLRKEKIEDEQRMLVLQESHCQEWLKQHHSLYWINSFTIVEQRSMFDQDWS